MFIYSKSLPCRGDTIFYGNGLRTTRTRLVASAMGLVRMAFELREKVIGKGRLIHTVPLRNDSTLKVHIFLT